MNVYMEFLFKIDVLLVDIKNFRMFYDICEVNICGLEVFGVKMEIYGSLLIFIFLKKIFEEIWYLIFRVDFLVDSFLDRLRIVM